MKTILRFLLLAVCCLGLFLLPAPAQAAPYADDFFDDFNDGDMEGWGIWGPATWTVENGELVGALEQADGLAGISTGSVDWSNYVLEFEVTLDTGGLVGMGFRATDVRGYWLVLNVGTDTVNLGTSREGQGSYGLEAVDYALSNGELYRVKIVMSSATLLIYVDDRFILQYIDPDPIMTGNISLEANTLDSSPAIRVRYDNVRITHLDEQVYLPLLPN
ncbi:MAG: family 16 glycoside hydrolase [Caldilineaceae bacterium]